MKNQTKIILTLFIGVLMGALDISIVGPAIPSIEKTVAISAEDVRWIFSIYVLFNLVGISLFSKLSDLYGRRNIYAIAVALFLIGSLWVAGSHHAGMILIGRAIQGFGASGIFPVASAVVGDIFPPEKRGRMLGLIGMVFGLAFIIGPILAGVLLLFFNWNALFYINVPLSVFLLYSSLRYLPSQPVSQDLNFDWKGVLLLGASLGFLSFGLSKIDAGAISSSLASPLVYVNLLLFMAGTAALIRTERKQEQPALNIALIKSRQVAVTSLLSVGTGFFQAMFVFFPKLAADVLHFPASKASFMLVPTVIATAVGAPVFGRMLDKFGPRKIVALAMSMMTIGVLSAYFLVGTPIMFYISGVFIGLSLSILSGSALRYILLNEVSAGDRASTQGFVSIFISVGQMVNAIILGGILANATSSVSGFAAGFLMMTIVSSLLLFASLLLRKEHILKS
jgi:EmrB/QacA subfamily drug resistance transporter